MPESLVRRRPNWPRGYGADRVEGQALVEFTLVVPIMILLLLGVADLGRLFASAIVVQAASRDGAEAAAQQYVQQSRSSAIDYGVLHATAERVTCAEAQRLPSAAVNTDAPPHCTVPAIAVCVHDAGVNGSVGDPSCGQTIGSPTADELASCPNLASAWSTAPDGTSHLPYVEVRVCYPFSMLLQTQILPIGPLFLQQSSNFVAATY